MPQGTLFPRPVYLGRRRFWRLSDVLAFERELAGLPMPQHTDPAAERWLTAAQMRARYAVSDMWLWRRTREADEQPKAT